MKIFIDTNIFIDVIIKRKKYFIDSAKVWSLVSEKEIQGSISAISINNLYYILRKRLDKEIVAGFIDQLLNEFEIISLTKEILYRASSENISDFEDSIQYISALECNSEYLVTRNVKDFPRKNIEIINPYSFIRKILA